MKKVLILWTGGLDSTYLIIKNLFLGNKVYLGYVNISNNENCMIAEHNARVTILKYIDKLMSKINFKGKLVTQVKQLCSISIDDGTDFPYAQVPLFFIPLTNCIFTYDEIQMGYVNGDYHNSDLFISKFSNIYNSYIDLITTDITGDCADIKQIAKLTFPLSNTTKQEEILLFKSIDNKYKTKILDNLVHCENIQEKDGKYVSCNECGACNKFENAYDSLEGKNYYLSMQGKRDEVKYEDK